jgi:hypothetical protein
MLTGYTVAILPSPNPPDSTSQTLEIVLTFDGAVAAEDPGAAIKATVTINGPATARVQTCTPSGNTLTIDLAASMGYNTVLQGLLAVTGYANMTIGGAAPGSDDNLATTVIPLGEVVTYGNEGLVDNPTAPVTLTISDTNPSNYAVSGNGMIHLGLYSAEGGSSDRLIPIWNALSDTDPIQVYTQTAFVDDYTTFLQPNGAAALATTIIKYINADSAFDKNTYSLTSSGNVISFSKLVPDGEPLYMYIFDDNLIKAIQNADVQYENITYQDIKDNSGILPIEPDFS